MAQTEFADIWSSKVAQVRQSDFWSVVSRPSGTRIVRPDKGPESDETAVEDGWGVRVEGEVAKDGPCFVGASDLSRFLRKQLAIKVSSVRNVPKHIRFVFRQKLSGSPDRWDSTFRLSVKENSISLIAASEHGLLRGSLYLPTTGVCWVTLTWQKAFAASGQPYPSTSPLTSGVAFLRGKPGFMAGNSMRISWSWQGWASTLSPS